VTDRNGGADYEAMLERRGIQGAKRNWRIKKIGKSLSLLSSGWFVILSRDNEKFSWRRRKYIYSTMILKSPCITQFSENKTVLQVTRIRTN
jgi:hypothetical protein